jgi:hypothetical protein
VRHSLIVDALVHRCPWVSAAITGSGVNMSGISCVDVWAAGIASAKNILQYPVEILFVGGHKCKCCGTISQC